MKLIAAKRRLPLPAGQNLTLILAGLLLGLVLVVRWKDVGVTPTDVPAAARERAAEAVDQLEREQEQLKSTIARLRADLAGVRKQAAQNTGLLAEMSAELEREQAEAGLVALRGPGVVVQLDDSNVAAPAPGTDPELYIIHDSDLRDVANLLWDGGAEAIAINDERLVNTTSVYCVGSTIMVNDTRLSPPYLVRAIGDRQQLGALLENGAYLPGLRQRVKAYSVQLKISWAGQVDLPAYSGTFRLRNAHPGEVKP